MAVGTESAGGQFWYTKSIDAKYLNSGNYWVGVYRNPSGGHIFGTETSDDGYRKTNTSGFPSISSMSGYSTDASDEPTVGVFYITTPDPVTSASVSRVSDTKQTITWTRHSSSDQPYDNIYIERWDNVSNNWYNKATLSGSATSYSDTSTVYNKRYRYRVRAKNTAGYSSYAYTDYIRTTPAAVTNVVAVRSGTSVNITWSNPATAETNLTIQRKTSTDGISWGSYSTLSSAIAADATSYVDSSPANYNQYQVRTDCTDPTLHSSYVESNIVIIITPPDAPSGLVPDSLYPFDADNSQLFEWSHNPVDGTGQTKFSLQYRIQGDAWPGTPQINEEVSTNESYTFAGATFSNGEIYEWQVKTWGDHATASDWSDTATFTTVTTPAATITDPTALSDYGYSLLTMTWTYTQTESESQTQYIAELYDASDNLLEILNNSSLVVDGSDGTATFAYTLENATTYTVKLLVKCESELWSDQEEVTFATDFYVPPTPTIEIEEDSTICGVNITITNPSPAGTEVATDHNILYRSIDSGDWEIVYDDIEPNTIVTDYLPSIGGNTNYYVEAVSTTPSIAASAESNLDIEYVGFFVINGGNEYEDFMILKGDISVDEAFSRETVTQQYEGRTNPVKYQGVSLEQRILFSCDILKTDYSTLKDLIQFVGNHHYRDYNGRWFMCAILNPKVQKKDNLGYQFSCEFLKVEGEN